ncbi:MAG: peptide deformylase [Gammaproteobacteria bacterium]|nr:peptide deformylase [Gammaproteobacteria bacterium]
MAILHILHYPDERLRRKAVPVTSFGPPLQRLISDMLETMYDAPGVGLAAPQVDVDQRLLVIDISEDRSRPLCLINPEILECSDSEQMEEGCLSVPGVYEKVERAAWVRVRAQDRDGTSFELEADGLLAVCIQHEIDHLEGKLFVDYLSSLKRKRLDKRLDKMRRHNM